MHTAYREDLLAIFQAGLAAVAPDKALLRHVSLQGNSLLAGGKTFDLAQGRVLVLGGGKGAAPMAAALEALLGDRIREGRVVVKYDHALPLKQILLDEAGHPVPDEAGQRATAAMLEIAHAAKEEDLVICVLTGGASALTPAPVAGVSLADVKTVTSLLLQCGATINELNAVRKHLSCFSGGQLARAAAPARVLCVIVSDVVGDLLDVIASGPTAPDSATFAQCMEIVQKYGLEARLPESVRAYLVKGVDGQAPETPKADDPIFARVTNLLVATNGQALHAAANKAKQLGYEPRILTDELEGEAKDQAVLLVDEARTVAASLSVGARPVCLLAGGETTVTITGSGKGGRNQEMALAAALALDGEPRIAALFAGTDGTDGPTDAAGGYANGISATAMRKHCNPEQLLKNNDSYNALPHSNDLLKTGPTRTNVMDVGILLVHPPAASVLK